MNLNTEIGILSFILIMNTSKSYNNKTKTVVKALRILEELSGHSGSLTNKEIAEKLGMHPSTSYRLLTTLTKEDYIRKGNNRYQIGFKLLRLQALSRETKRIKRIVYPFLSSLSDQTRLTTNLAIREGLQIILIDIVKGSTQLTVNANLGKSVPPHASAVGKALLSVLPKRQRNRTVNSLSLQRFTSNTITQPNELMDELQLTRNRGFARDKEEFVEGIHCLGVPICPEEHDLSVSISISALTTQIRSKGTDNLIKQLKNASKKISLELCG